MTPRAFARTIAGIPLLVTEPTGLAEPWPVVLWCHGYAADALAHAGELERCAAAGRLAIGIDAPLHGARRDETALQARIAAAPEGTYGAMLGIVDDGVRELPALLDGLAAAYPIDRTRLSLVGISMGAFLAYHAIVSGPPLRAVVALLGSPEWPRAGSPHHFAGAFDEVALLSITAERDGHVDPAPVHRLHAMLAQRFRRPAQHRHHVLAGAGHLTNAAQWDEAMGATLDWLHAHG